MENEMVSFSIFSFALIAFGTFFVGRDKVNCGNAAREGALGYDLSAPFLTICKRLTVGAAIGRPFLSLYAMPDSILLHISATLRRRDTR